MNTITQTELSAASSYTAATGSDKTAQDAKTAKTNQNQAASSAAARKTSKVTNCKTIGEPELSEKAQKYYDNLRKKYGNLDFILVSEDKKAEAQANAGRYANANRMVVLIDTEKIERMAEDEEYRKKYEAIIGSATVQLAQIKGSLGVNAGSVKSYGMQVNEHGTASFFAVIDKSLAAQKDRIEKKAAQKAADKKAAQKAADKKRAEEKRTEKADEKKKAEKEAKEDAAKDTVTVTASSVEELLRKINDTIFKQMSDNARTESERKVGQNFDFSI